MNYIRCCIVIILLLLTSPILAGDLYLLQIDNQSDLEIAQSVIGRAYGMIGNKFVVDLSSHQVAHLKENGIMIKHLVSNFTRDRYYIAGKHHQQVSTTALSLSPLYAEGMAQIVELEPGSDQVLTREGYSLFNIGDFETPLFYDAASEEHPILLPSYACDTLAELVNQDSLYNHVVRMQNFYTRFMGSDSIGLANEWVKDKFREIGYTNLFTIPFSTGETYWGSFGGVSIICTKQGTENPDKYMLVGAHLDSCNNRLYDDFNIQAWGADDNASGVAAVLELARIMKDMDNKKTIMFVAFGGEELGNFGDMGSHFVADYIFDRGLDLELMVNLDMIGHTYDEYDNISLLYANSDIYKVYFSHACSTIADLIPGPMGTMGLSDDRYFIFNGYNTLFFHESDFNRGYHSSDHYGRMDFPYFRNVVKALVTGVAIIDQSPEPIDFWINDFGDGQGLRVSWDETTGAESYTIIWKPSKTTYPPPPPDTIFLPAGITHFDFEGLSAGMRYNFGVYHIVDGYPQLAFSTKELGALVIPRGPEGLIVSPTESTISLFWQSAVEFDLSHYQIYRKMGSDAWLLLEDNFTDTTYIDSDVLPGIKYNYRLTSVDNDNNVSDFSNEAGCYLLSFDQGVLLVDETQTGGVNPDETSQHNFYFSMLEGHRWVKVSIDSLGDDLGHATMGQYNPIFWMDDDDSTHLWENYQDTLRWFFSYGNDLLFSGWNSIYAQTGHTYFYPGNFLYDELGINYVNSLNYRRFVGALGEGDWPDLILREDAPYLAHLPDIQTFGRVEGCETIYRYQSEPYHEGFDGKTIGFVYDTYNGKRLILGFPLHWMTPESAHAFVVRALEYFAEPSTPPPPPVRPYGDINNDYAVNITDITFLIKYKYKDGPAPDDLNYADVNADCVVNVKDITYLIKYKYKYGPEPLEGCVN
jgi:hypothetical protein